MCDRHRMKFCTSVVIVLALVGCSKKEDGAKGKADTTSDPVTTPSTPAGKELPAAPAAELRGAVRVINVLKDKDGTPMAFDVWGRRSFKWAPIQYAKNVAYGTATEWYGTPKGTSAIAVPVGAGPDAKEITMVWSPGGDDEQLSNLVYFDQSPASAMMALLPRTATNNAPELPPAGKGLVYFNASQLRASEATLAPTYGGRSFFIGDGTGKCIYQRVQSKGFGMSVLGGTQPVEHDAAPGKVTFTFHKYPAQKDKECLEENKKFEVTVDVVEGKGTLVVLHTPDGKKIEALQLPLWK